MFKLLGFDQSSSGQQSQKYGWNNTSHDYQNHLNQIMRTASVLPDVPHYPSVHNIFKKKADMSTELMTPRSPSKSAKKKVHIAEEDVISNNAGNSGTVEESYEESVDMDADSFIQQKHRGFELCKWTTFTKAR